MATEGYNELDSIRAQRMGETSMATDGYNERGSIRAQRMMAAEGYNERGSIRAQTIRQLQTSKTLQQQLERNNGKGVQATCGGTKKMPGCAPDKSLAFMAARIGMN